MSMGPKPGESADEFVARKMANKLGNKHQKKLTSNHLLTGEEVIAWAPAFRDGTTFEGICAVTSSRVIFFRAGTLGDKLEPFPLDKVSSVETKRGLMFLDATIHTSNDSLKLRFAQKAKGDEVMLALQEAMHKPAATSAPPPAPAPTKGQVEDGPMQQIVKLGELMDAGLLTEEEFNTKKAELLSRI